MTMSVKYQDLTLNSQLVFTVWEVKAPLQVTDKQENNNAILPPLGGTTLRMFNKRGALRYGRQKLYLWRGVSGDGAMISSTPHKIMPNKGVDKLTKVLI